VYDCTAIRAAIPKELAPQAFLDEERDFGWRMCSTGGYPTSLYATSLNQTWFRRLMMQGIAAWSVHDSNVLPQLLEHIDDYMHATAMSSCTGIALAGYWDEIVMQDPPSVRVMIPPELDADVATSEVFEAWLANVRLLWTDTHEPVAAAEAIIVRLVCRYLAANAAMRSSQGSWVEPPQSILQAQPPRPLMHRGLHGHMPPETDED
jgi:hypothetical protein